MTDLFEEFDEFDEQSQKILMEYKDSFLDFNNIEKQEKDPFEGIRTNKTFQEISNEITMGNPFGKKSTFHIPPKEDFSLSSKFRVSKGLKKS